MAQESHYLGQRPYYLWKIFKYRFDYNLIIASIVLTLKMYSPDVTCPIVVVMINCAFALCKSSPPRDYYCAFRWISQSKTLQLEANIKINSTFVDSSIKPICCLSRYHIISAYLSTIKLRIVTAIDQFFKRNLLLCLLR